MAASEQLITSPSDEVWLSDAVEVGTTFSVAIEYLRSRLPGYPMLRVPHRRKGSPYLIESGMLFHSFPWNRAMSKFGLQLQAKPPDLSNLGGASGASELTDLAGVLMEREAWQRFTAAEAALTSSDVEALSEIGSAFTCATSDEELDKATDGTVGAAWSYRMATLRALVDSSEGRVHDYLRGFEDVHELITFAAAIAGTAIIRGEIPSVIPGDMVIGPGPEFRRSEALVAAISESFSFTNPGEVVVLKEGPTPDGVIRIERVTFKLDEATARIGGEFMPTDT